VRLLFGTAVETLIAIARRLKHLRARIGLTAVLRGWDSALTADQCILRKLSA
jgi:hypothetical protein